LNRGPRHQVVPGMIYGKRPVEKGGAVKKGLGVKRGGGKRETKNG